MTSHVLNGSVLAEYPRACSHPDCRKAFGAADYVSGRVEQTPSGEMHRRCADRVIARFWRAAQEVA